MPSQKFEFINSPAAPLSSGFGAKRKTKHSQKEGPVIVALDEDETQKSLDEKDKEERERKSQARRANSHAAKVAHARRRRFMVLEYQGPQRQQEQTQMLQAFTKSGDGLKGGKDIIDNESQDQADLVITAWAKDKDQLLDREVVLELVTNGLLEMAGMGVGKMGIGVGDPMSILGAGRLDPFASFARALTGEEGFLFDHYIRFVIPFQSTHCNRILSTEAYQRTMIQDFAPLSYSRADTLDSVFLITCRHIVTVLSSSELSPEMKLPEGEKEYYSAMATRYKISCIKGLRESIARESGTGGWGWSNETVVCMLMLTSDELWSGDLEMARKHLKGAFQVVKLKGGPETLGCNGFMEKVMGMTAEDAQSSSVCLKTLVPS